MANRRMFSHDIVSSDPFTEMPTSSQALYFHLCMASDDDGFVNPRKIMRIISCSDDDLKVLLAKKFVLAFENGVVVIKHWLIHNTLSKDRYRETNYIEQKAKLRIEKNKGYTLNPEKGVPLMPEARAKKLLSGGNNNDPVPNGYQNGTEVVPQYRLGKVSIDKRNEGLFGANTPKPISKTSSKTDNITDTRKKNYETIRVLIEKGEFKKPEYKMEEGVFDWRYMIYEGSYLNPTKYMVALYWKLKQGYTRLRDQYGYNYDFKTRDKAGSVLTRDSKSGGTDLASTIEFKELAKLIEIVDDIAWSDKDKRYQFEWQMSTLLKNVQRIDA